MIYLNLADLFIVIVAAGSFYLVKEKKLLAGMFSLFAMIVTTFITLHYYVVFGEVLRVNLLPGEGEGGQVAFFLLPVWTLGIFAVIQRGWVVITEIKLPKWFDRWGGNLFYLVRGCLLGALIVLGMFTVKYPFVESLSRTSLSGYYMRDVSSLVYQKVFEKVIHPFFPNEVLNKEVHKLIYPEKKNKK